MEPRLRFREFSFRYPFPTAGEASGKSHTGERLIVVVKENLPTDSQGVHREHATARGRVTTAWHRCCRNPLRIVDGAPEMFASAFPRHRFPSP
jgi:hypothetical protein